jgi:DNA polymerase
VADPLRRWFELQRDLGGEEVIFDQPIAELPGARDRRRPPASAPVPVPTPAEPTGPAELRVTRYVPGEEPAWLVGAPAIPGPGLRVHSPQADLSVATERDGLDGLAATIRSCRRCPLCEGRTQAVPGEGHPTAGLMVIGEGPGEQEDLSGRPFVGRAGALLDKILESIDAPRPTVFIANVVKCRPPRNRAPLPDERAACLPYLHRQIALVRPKVLLALGATAAEAMLGVKQPLGSLRLKVHRYDAIPLVVSYHPAALLRNPNWKRPAWDDVRIARQLLALDD